MSVHIEAEASGSRLCPIKKETGDFSLPIDNE